MFQELVDFNSFSEDPVLFLEANKKGIELTGFIRGSPGARYKIGRHQREVLYKINDVSVGDLVDLLAAIQSIGHQKFAKLSFLCPKSMTVTIVTLVADLVYFPTTVLQKQCNNSKSLFIETYSNF